MLFNKGFKRRVSFTRASEPRTSAIRSGIYIIRNNTWRKSDVVFPKRYLKVALGLAEAVKEDSSLEHVIKLWQHVTGLSVGKKGD